MKIREPIVIRKLGISEYEATGRLEGYGIIRRYGKTEEEAKECFFQACNLPGFGSTHDRNRRHASHTMNA
jgi:hypothetical protein